MFLQLDMHISKTKRARKLWFVAFCSLYRPKTPQAPLRPPLEVLKPPQGGVRPTLRTTALNSQTKYRVLIFGGGGGGGTTLIFG